MRLRGLIVILVILFAAAGAGAVASDTLPDSFTHPFIDQPDEDSPSPISSPEQSPTTEPRDTTDSQTTMFTETTTPRLTEDDQVFCDDDPNDDFDCEPGIPQRNGSTVPPENESSSVSLDIPVADTQAGEPPGREPP